jgi:hypothetical protein
MGSAAYRLGMQPVYLLVATLVVLEYMIKRLLRRR